MKTLLIASTLVMLSFIGCKDPYGACVNASSIAAQTINQGMQTVDQLRQQGHVSIAEESSLLDYFEFANKADSAFLTCAQEAHTNGNKAGTYTACANTFNSSLNNSTELALLKVSDTTASQTITGVVQTVTSGITSLVTALGGS
jgi:hypothetical protein